MWISCQCVCVCARARARVRVCARERYRERTDFFFNTYIFKGESFCLRTLTGWFYGCWKSFVQSLLIVLTKQTMTILFLLFFKEPLSFGNSAQSHVVKPLLLSFCLLCCLQRCRDLTNCCNCNVSDIWVVFRVEPQYNRLCACLELAVNGFKIQMFDISGHAPNHFDRKYLGNYKELSKNLKSA